MRGGGLYHGRVLYARLYGSQSVGWPQTKNGLPQRQDLIDFIYDRLFSLFIDVLCIFAEDCGGLAGVVIKLTTWASMGSASNLPGAVRPRVLAVTCIPGDAFDSEVLCFCPQLFSTPEVL